MNKQEYLNFCILQKEYEEQSEIVFGIIKKKFKEIFEKTDVYLKEHLTEHEYKHPGCIDDSYFYFTKRRGYYLTISDDNSSLVVMLDGYDCADETVAKFSISAEMFEDDFVDVFMKNWITKEEHKQQKRADKKEAERLAKIKNLQEELNSLTNQQ